ncbi:MAG: helix-turn-helix domain-containing protein [Candidatus Eisenbacteria bacterium]|nr:helix-turn-helix domain-containing protein [Candidatus Eisenbacteria bacterium]
MTESSAPPSVRDFEILNTLSSIKAIAHEERLAMLELLKGAPMTAFGVAKALGIPPNQASYHLKVLEREGLASPAGLGRKRWKEERFYRARARAYLVDPGLGCEDPEVARSVRGSMEAAFLDWRRTQVLSVDFDQIARRVVNQCLPVRTGDVVLVLFMPAGLELAEAVQVELRRLGARPQPMLWSRRVAAALLEQHTAESLASYPFLDPLLDASLDAGLFISSNVPVGRPFPPEHLEKLPHLLAAVSRWHQSLRERRIPYIEITLPYRAEFEAGLMSEEDGIDAFFACLEADSSALAQRARSLADALRGHSSLTIRGPRETELVVTCDLDRPHINDGVITEEDRRAGRTFKSLPAGTVSFLPRNEGTNGSLYLERAYVVGRHFREVTFSITSGRIVALESPHDVEELRRLIAKAAGEPERIAEVGIGINPGAHTLSGKAVLDSRMEGTVTVMFGNNELIGGDVRSTLSMILPSRSHTVRVDHDRIVEEGRLIAAV